MDEAQAFLETLTNIAADAPTACAGWTAHELVAHMAAGAAEMAALTEASLAGEPSRPTRDMRAREASFLALDDAVLRDRLFTEALRLAAATDELAAAGPNASVSFAGRALTASELSMHGRSEAALHRWDLAGDDDVGRDLLSQPELTAHAVTVLSSMLDGAPESVAARATALDAHPARLVFASPGHPDVVFVHDGLGVRFEMGEEQPNSATPGEPTVTADPATRLLALWGRRSTLGLIDWAGDPDDRRSLAALLWAQDRAPQDL